jgi:transposase
MEQKIFYTAEEVAEMFGISRSHAYKMIREMNTELAAQGYLTFSGKVSCQYLKQKCTDCVQHSRKEKIYAGIQR